MLNRLVRSGKISKAGMAAYLAAVDPFHDKPIDGLEGHPDSETTASVVRCINYSNTVTSLEAGGAIVICTYPILNSINLRTVARRNSIVDSVFDGVSTNSTIGPLVIYRFTAAQVAAGAMNLTGASSPVFDVFTLPDGYFKDGPMRMIGMGLEVHDVTAVIDKQGTLTLAQIPQAVGERESITVRAQTVGVTPYVQTNVEVVPMSRFPNTLAGAMLYPTTRQWEAKEGCYTVIPFTGQDNYFSECEYRTPWVDASSNISDDGPYNLNNSGKLIGAWAAGSPSGDNFVFLPSSLPPVHSKVVYLTGLSAASTYTINARMFVEVAPNAASGLVTLAKPSARFDPVALALISAAMKKLPVGVDVGANPLGEWFWDTLQAALPFIGGIGSVLLPEFSPLILGATAAGEAALQKRKQKAKKKANKAPAVQPGKMPPLPPVPRKKK